MNLIPTATQPPPPVSAVGKILDLGGKGLATMDPAILEVVSSPVATRCEVCGVPIFLFRASPAMTWLLPKTCAFCSAWEAKYAWKKTASPPAAQPRPPSRLERLVNFLWRLR